MRKVGLLIIIGVFLLFFGVYRNLERKVEFEIADVQTEDFIEHTVRAPTKPQEILAVTKTFEPPESKTPTETKWTQKNEGEPKPDRFKLRKLDLPRPTSVQELVKNLTAFIEPALPVASSDDRESFDGDVLTIYRGYYELPDGTLRRIEVARVRANGVATTGEDGGAISIEDQNGKDRVWNASQLKFANFNKDPYSLVITFPSKQILYLKFYTRLSVPDLPNDISKTRAQIGWLLSNETVEAKTMRVALIDGMLETDPDLMKWPSPESIKKILPPVLK